MAIPELLATIYDSVSTKITAINDAQIAANEYLQYRPTHSIIPLDNNGTVCDKRTDSPPDGSNWNNIIADGESLPAQLIVDMYEGPLGTGYVINIKTRVTNADSAIETWLKTLNYGPETYREQDWHIIEGGS